MTRKIITRILLLALTPLILANFGLHTSTPGFSVYAQELNWELIYNSINETTAIRGSKLKSGLIYASIRKKGWDFDLLKSNDNGNNWVSIKRGLPSGGDINWISLHPTNQHFVAISLWGAGFFVSYDEGNTWVMIKAFAEPRLIEVNPLNPDNEIFVGGTNNFGLHRLTKINNTWVDQQILSGGNTAQIIIDSHNPQRIFADAGTSFYRSQDGGNTWEILPINEANSAGGLAWGEIIYTGKSGTNPGVYKSTDGGKTWIWKNNNGLIGNIYNFSHDEISGSIFVTRAHNHGGGLWKTTNGGDTWENISSPLWGTRNTWGTEAINNFVFVSVESLGLFRANLQSPSTPSPVVFLPGFGGSWSYKGLVENKPTTAEDWTLIPFSDPYYKPFLNALKNAGLSDSGDKQNLFIFAYDYRKSVVDTAIVLNNYLDHVLSKNPGKKANIVAHSMGGLVARQCYEKVTGCSSKIGKIVTLGSSHQGTIKAYQLWQGGEINVSDLATKAAIEIALRVTNLPYLSTKDIIQNQFPGVRDLLPIFDFIDSRPYLSMSYLGKNPNLENLLPISSSLNTSIYPLSGNNIPTYASFSTAPLTIIDTALGLWTDGKPNIFSTLPGDGTVLKKSSEINGNAHNQYYPFEHNDYLRDLSSVVSIFTILGLNPPSEIPSSPSPTSFLSFIIHSPAIISVKDEAGNNVGTNIDGKAVFILNPTNQNYQVNLIGTGNGPISLDSFYTDPTGATFKKTYNGNITAGTIQTVNYKNHDLISSLPSFRIKASSNNYRPLRIIEANTIVAVNNIRNNKNRSNAFLNLEKSLLDIWQLVSLENNGQLRQNLAETAEQLQSLLTDLNSQYRSEPVNNAVEAEIARAQLSINKKLSLTSLSVREAANLTLAQTKLEESQKLLTANRQYAATLSSRAAIILSQ